MAEARGPPETPFQIRDVSLVTYRLGAMSKPFARAVFIRTLGRRCVRFVDANGREMRIGLGALARLGSAFVRDRIDWPLLILRAGRDVGRLEGAPPVTDLSWDRRPLYLRTDLALGLRSGGSVGHTSGVVNELGKVWPCAPVFVTTDDVGGIKSDIETP